MTLKNAAFLAFLAERARELGMPALEGEFIPTAKNAPAADFYQRHGFTRVNGSRWRLELADVSFAWPASIQRHGPAKVELVK